MDAHPDAVEDVTTAADRGDQNPVAVYLRRHLCTSTGPAPLPINEEALLPLAVSIAGRVTYHRLGFPSTPVDEKPPHALGSHLETCMANRQINCRAACGIQEASCVPWVDLPGADGEPRRDSNAFNTLCRFSNVPTFMAGSPGRPADMNGNLKTCIAIGAVLIVSPLAFGQSFGDGTHLVGSGIQAGTYRAPGGEWCMWERLSGLSGDMSDWIAGDVPTGGAIVEIKPTDKAFKASGCGTWEIVGEARTSSRSIERLNMQWRAVVGALVWGISAVADLDSQDFPKLREQATEWAEGIGKSWNFSAEEMAVVNNITQQWINDFELLEMD